MGNAPSAQHGSPTKHQQDGASPSRPSGSAHPPPHARTDSAASGSHAASSSRHPNLRLPMPARQTHISPQSSNPTSPSGRSSSPRRRKSLELPDLNKLSFTPAAAVTTVATTTSHATTPSGSKKVQSPETSASPSSAPASGSKRWQQVLGGRTVSPLAGANALSAMSRLDGGVPGPKTAPLAKNATTSPPRYNDQTSYFPPSPVREASPRRAVPVPIPIPGKDDPPKKIEPLRTTGITPPATSKAATPPSRAEVDSLADRSPPEPTDGLVNVPIQWVGGGKNVFVTGNFANNWKDRIKLKKSTHDFNTVLRLPPGQYRLKFVVDESWLCSKQIPTATDDDGTLVNWIEVEARKTEEELKAEWAADTRPAGKQEDRDDSQWTNVIPPPLVCYQYIEELPSSMSESEFDTFLRGVQHLSAVPQPPMLPRILDKVIVNAEPKQKPRGEDLNSHAIPLSVGLDDNSILAVPNHVVLNHLTASAIKNGTLGVGTTTRYRKKYITTMFFKPTLGDLMGDTPAAVDGSATGQ